MPIAIVTGAGRKGGLGFEVARQLAAQGMTVVLTARSGEAARDRAQDLAMRGLDVLGDVLDVADESSIADFAQRMGRTVQRVDVLVNHAAGPAALGESPCTADLASARAVMDVTLFGAWRLCQALLPLMSHGGRIVNVSRGAGPHGDPASGLTSAAAMGPGDAVARAALHAFTALLARELAPRGILVNAVCPGSADSLPGALALGARSVVEGAAGIVWAATLPADGPTGGLFGDGRPLPW